MPTVILQMLEKQYYYNNLNNLFLKRNFKIFSEQQGDKIKTRIKNSGLYLL